MIGIWGNLVGGIKIHIYLPAWPSTPGNKQLSRGWEGTYGNMSSKIMGILEAGGTVRE